MIAAFAYFNCFSYSDLVTVLDFCCRRACLVANGPDLTAVFMAVPDATYENWYFSFKMRSLLLSSSSSAPAFLVADYLMNICMSFCTLSTYISAIPKCFPASSYYVAGSTSGTAILGAAGFSDFSSGVFTFFSGVFLEDFSFLFE